jgi:hypothetical protein
VAGSVKSRCLQDCLPLEVPEEDPSFPFFLWKSNTVSGSHLLFLVMWEAEIQRITIQGQSRQIVLKTSSPK